MAVVYKNTSEKVAHLAPVRAAVRSEAAEVASKAESLISGDGSTTLGVEVGHGSTDALVSLVDNDTGRGEPAAAAIEYGHTAPNGRWVEGKWYLHRAAGLRG